MFKPNAPFATIATKDVGEVAAEMLTEEPWGQPHMREPLGPGDYTMAEAARIFGAAIGKPNLNYVQFPYDDARKVMLGTGLSESCVDGVIELVRSFNEGALRAMQQLRSAQNTTSTTLQEFADEVFRRAYERIRAA
jgi:uncharacterized protein YbjT (DUF2867 family)